MIKILISYDYDFLNGGKITPLKTEEILTRGKGVCQHFANSFAAIDRGLGVPTQMVVGFYSGDSGRPAGAHAWNEIEIRPNLWRPIEPQAPISTSVYLTIYL